MSWHGFQNATINGSRESCPCRKWRIESSILSSVTSENDTESFTEFLVRGKSVSCPECGPSRISAAYCILNGIRDGCRRVTNSSPLVPCMNIREEDLTDNPISSSKNSEPRSYDNNFPSLGATPPSTGAKILIGRKKQAKNWQKGSDSKSPGRGGRGSARSSPHISKRRIRPATTAIGTPSPSHRRGNIASLPSEDPSVMMNMINFKTPPTKKEYGAKKSVTTKIGTPSPSHRRGNIVSLPSEDPSVMMNTVHSKNPPMKKENGVKKCVITTIGTPSPSHRRGNIVSLPSEDPSVMMNTVHPKTSPMKKENSAKKCVTITIGTPSPSHRRGNIVSLPSEDPSIMMNMSHFKTPPTKKEMTNYDASVVNEKQVGNTSDEELKKSVTKITPVPEGIIKPIPTINSEAAVSLEVAGMVQDELCRLVKIYVAILENQLVPSTIMELHLVMRLLSVSNEESKEAPSSPQSQSQSSFSSIFSSTTSCNKFATCVLQATLHTILIHLPYPTLKTILKFPPFINQLPQMTETLQTTISSHTKPHLLHVSPLVSPNGNKPIAFLAFSPARDSRHNYRSTDESRTYQTREEIRDMFLGQLRHFQQYRMDPDHMRSNEVRIKRAAKEILSKVLQAGSAVVFWFSDFFSELLVQIGTKEVGEYDEEILRTVGVDAGRLQKLHRRFTAKNNLAVQNPSQKKTKPSPEELFTGHEEYFFLFLQSADSYCFVTHLVHRFIGDLQKIYPGEENNLCQKLIRQRLIAKFLGLLIFSPNYIDKKDCGLAYTNTMITDATHHVNFSQPLFPLKQYILQAQQEGMLICVIPWVVEYLKMATWDPISMKSSYYQHVFGLLWIIHQHIASMFITKEDIPCDELNSLTCNMMVVALHLESLFTNFVGMEQTEQIPKVVLPLNSGKAGVDRTCVYFSEELLFASCPYLEEFHALMTAKGSHNTTGGASKKLRPCTLSTEPVTSTGDTMEGSESGQTKNGSTTFSLPKRISANSIPTSNFPPVRGKLVDAFFHQHQDLQRLAEFIVRKCIENHTSHVVQKCLKATIEIKLLSYPKKNVCHLSTNTDARSCFLNDIESKAEPEAADLLNQTNTRTIKDAMHTLSPPFIDERVRNMSVTLATEHARKEGARIVKLLVNMESGKYLDLSLASVQDEQGPTKDAKISKENAILPAQSQELVFAACLEDAIEYLICGWESVNKESGESSQKISDARRAIMQMVEIPIDLERADIITKVHIFVETYVSLVKDGLAEILRQDRSKEKLRILLDGLQIAIALGNMGPSMRNHLKRIGAVFCEPLAVSMMIRDSAFDPLFQTDAAEDRSGTPRDTNSMKGSLWVGLVRGGLINEAQLERTFLYIIKNGGRNIHEVALYCVERLCPIHSNDEFGLVDHNTLAMSKLRTVLSQVQNISLELKS